ncbi:MAG: LacI family DNA-binding transcriptional regulator [Anaerolineaceae bacterium]
MSPVTIKDVARVAQVSITTVSHVINETRFVETETKERVLAAMKQLGYQPNSLARSLRSGVTKMLGLIVPDASNLFFAEIARKIEDIGFRQGYSVVLCNSDNDPNKQKTYVNTLIEKRVDGVIFISSGSEPDDLMHLVENQIPVVVADRDVPLELADVVLVDNKQAGYEATQHLVELGHRIIACITGPNNLSPSAQRFEGFRQCLFENRIPVYEYLFETGDFGSQSGKEAMLRILSNPTKPTAVFIMNDMMAIGAIAAARSIGFSIPKDLSIIGFDDIQLDSVVSPALTTMAQPVNEMAIQATTLLLDRLNGSRKERNQRMILQAHLVERDSTSRHL